MSDNWYTVTEAATLLGVSSQTVRRRISSGELESKKEENRRYVKVEQDDIPELKLNNMCITDDTQSDRHEYELRILEERNQNLQEKMASLKERIRELEEDKGFLLNQIEKKDRVIKELMPKALPKPKQSIGEKIKGLFRRQDTKQLQST